MSTLTTKSLEKSELFEMLAFMVIGASIWYVGMKFGVFEGATKFVLERHLFPVVMLSSCMCGGAVVAAVRKFILLRRVIRERMIAEPVAEATARHDALTGLANRRLFHERLEAALAEQNPIAPFAVMIIDLDRFKPINAVHGHAAGNVVLCAVADRLGSVVPPGSTIARPMPKDAIDVYLIASEERAEIAPEPLKSVRAAA